MLTWLDWTVRWCSQQAKIVGQLEDTQGCVRQLKTDINNVDMAIRLFAPDIDLA